MTCLLTSSSCHTKSVRLYAHDLTTLFQASLLFAHCPHVFTVTCSLQPHICERSMLLKKVLLGVDSHLWCFFCLIRQEPLGGIEWPQFLTYLSSRLRHCRDCCQAWRRCCLIWQRTPGRACPGSSQPSQSSKQDGSRPLKTGPHCRRCSLHATVPFSEA